MNLEFSHLYLIDSKYRSNLPSYSTSLILFSFQTYSIEIVTSESGIINIEE